MDKARTEEELPPPYKRTIKHCSLTTNIIGEILRLDIWIGKFPTINGNLKICVMHSYRIQILDYFHGIGLPNGDVNVDTVNILDS